MFHCVQVWGSVCSFLPLSLVVSAVEGALLSLLYREPSAPFTTGVWCVVPATKTHSFTHTHTHIHTHTLHTHLHTHFTYIVVPCVYYCGHIFLVVERHNRTTCIYAVYTCSTCIDECFWVLLLLLCPACHRLCCVVMSSWGQWGGGWRRGWGRRKEGLSISLGLQVQARQPASLTCWQRWRYVENCLLCVCVVYCMCVGGCRCVRVCVCVFLQCC